MAIASYSTTPALNVSINGLNIAEGMARGDINNAFRELMADIKTWTNSYSPVSTPVSIANGGTGAITASAALTALAASGGTIGGNLTRSGKGVHPYWGSTSATGGQMYLQAVGSDPTVNPYDVVFEY